MQTYVAMLVSKDGVWTLLIRNNQEALIAEVFVIKEQSSWDVPSKKTVREALDKAGWEFIKKVRGEIGIYVVAKKEDSGV